MSTKPTFLSVAVRRTFNIGNFESVSFEAAVQVDQQFDEQAAFDAANAFVHDQFAQWRSANPSQEQTQPPRNGNSIKEPDGPASEKQRNYMDTIVRQLGWDTERLTAYVSDKGLNLLTLTKREASDIIEELKGINDGRIPAPAYTAPPTPLEQAVEAAQPMVAENERATPRQVRALQRLQSEREVNDYNAGAFTMLSMDEASNLIADWQQRPRRKALTEYEDLPF